MAIHNVINHRCAIYRIVTVLSFFGLMTAANANGMDGQSVLNLQPCRDSLGVIVSTQSFAVPSVGVTNEAEVGQSIISTFRINVMTGVISFDNDITISGSYFGQDFDVTVPAGKLAQPDNGTVYYPASYTFKYRNDSEPRTGISRPSLSIFMDATTKILVANLNFGFANRSIPIDTSKVRFEQCTVIGQDGYKRELVYSGVSKGTVSLLYREFVNDMARPAFSEELHYDLSDGNEIGYKGGRFKILKANNTGITYEVLKPLD